MSTTDATKHGLSHFYFAIPRTASKATREAAPQHVANNYGIRGPIEHVRSELAFHLYRIEATR